MQSRSVWQRTSRLAVCLLALCVLWLMPLGRAEAVALSNDWQYQLQPNTEWNGFDYPQLPQLPDGVRMVWLRTTLLPGDEETDTLMFMTFMQSVRIWAGDNLVYNYGSFEVQHQRSGVRWHLVRLPRVTEPTELRLLVYADTAEALYSLNTLSLASGELQVQRLFLYDIPICLALPAAILIVFLMLLCCKFNNVYWRRLYLAVALFMLVFALWTVTAAHAKTLLFDQPVFWWYAISLIAYLLPLSANVVLYELLKHEPHAYPGVVLALNGLLLAAAVGGELTGQWTLNDGMWAYYPLLGVTEAALAWWLIMACRRGNELCLAILPATIGFTLLGLFDGIMGHFHWFAWRLYVTPLGIFPFMYFVMQVLRAQLGRERSLVARTAQLQYKVAQATERSERDTLTGCYNRSAADRLYAEAVRQAVTRQVPLALIMLDIDHFKRFNDTYGHETGDQVLVQFSQTLRHTLSKEKPLIRWGGEEFIILCPDMTPMEALVLANELRRQVAAARLDDLQITCSLGVSGWLGKEKDTLNALCQRADRALYRAKESGRNRALLDETAAAGEK